MKEIFFNIKFAIPLLFCRVYVEDNPIIVG
jgi:hypothetical protein